MSPPLGRGALAVFPVFVVAAAYVVLVELHRVAPFPAFDVYIYFIPNKLHAVYAAWHGGKGLLWNPYQACGEPFFANPAMGLLYPPHLLFLVLDPNTAVHTVLAVNMVIGALGMLALARAMGLGAAAAVGAALAFELGDGMMELTTWSPMHSGPWAWVPWALFFCERLLRAPSRGAIAGLAAVLALGLLPGWVLIVALTYQLIGIRLLWEIAIRRSRRLWQSTAAVVAGLALAPLLVAVQLLPAAALARESQRLAFDFADFWAYGGLATNVAASIRGRVPPVPFIATALVLAAVAPFTARDRRLTGFYLVVGAVSAILALGPATPLFALYVKLPPGGATLRYPNRLFWITGLCIVVLAALAIDGVGASAGRRGVRRSAAIVALLVSTALWALTPGGLRHGELVLVSVVAATLVAASLRRELARPAAWLVAGAVVLNLLAVPLRFPGRLLSSSDGLRRHAAGFAALRARMSAQDRALIESSLSSMFELGLLVKSATVMRIPTVYDYEPLIGHRLGNYFSAMWHGSQITSGRELATAPTVLAGYRWRLSDVASIRYLVTPPTSPFPPAGADVSPIEIDDPGLRVFAAPGALPRARLVSRVEIVDEPDALLSRLAYGNDDLGAVALLEEPFPSGFAGGHDGAGSGSVRFVRDDPEHIVLDVDAPARGFLVLADQYAPGWQARVNDTAATIRRANYAFRAIEVPAGRSRVEFRYRPASLAAGAAISAAALAIVGATLLAKRNRHRGS